MRPVNYNRLIQMNLQSQLDQLLKRTTLWGNRTAVDPIFIRMSDSTDPMDTIKNWQDWYKGNRIVAQMDEPMVSKDSRESLHDTSKAVDAMPDWREYWAEVISDKLPLQSNDTYKKKATDYFADIIAEFFNEMSGQELFDCFAAAAKQNLEFATKEYDHAKDLMDVIQGKGYGQK